MPSNTTILLLLLFVFAFCLSDGGVYAFGAGNIPSFAYLEGKAFRHGDIEDVLEDLVKKAGGFALGAILGKGGSKFNGLDIKRVYFGNWLRDYSQAMDIAAFKKMPQQTILNLIMVLGFMANGYATHEFEVTFERLGVYLPVEHIDNPKGYGEGEDARKYHPALRPPVNPQELEVDNRTGMKNYIANENGNWDTSKALVRRTLEKCIHHGRLHRANGQKADEYEAYRLLGTALHTLEDFTAHSNWCELVLVQMGFHDVFLHVGDQVRIQAPNGRWVAPIVTGTFGSNDFFHSLLGEAGDHLSQASVSDLNKALDSARSASNTSRSGPGGLPSDPGDILRGLFSAIPGGAGGDMMRDMDAVERIRASSSGGGGYMTRDGPGVGGQPIPGSGKKPEDMSPQELHAVLWQVLTFRDSVVKKISKTIEKIPGLGPLIDKLMDAISVFIFTTLEPFLKPILQTTTGGLHAISGEVIDSHDQYEVFNDPRASDPTHSFLSKDHFNLILNEPAGRVAKVIVTNAVQAVIKAWDNTSVNVHQLTEEILECLFHPEWHNPQSKVQREMVQTMHDWANGLGHRKNDTISRLNKQAVRDHKNIRLAGDGGAPASQGGFAEAQGHAAQQAIFDYAGKIPGVSQVQHALGGVNHGVGREGPGGYGSQGAAASFYGSDTPSSHSHSSYAPPSGPPPAHNPHGSHSYAPPSGPPPGASSPYGPPSGPPPNFPGSGGYHPAHPPSTSPYGAPPIMSTSSSMSSDTPLSPVAPHHAGYAPSYASPPPSFPGAGPSFPGAESGYGGPHHGYGGPPGGFAPPPGPPQGGPGFPSGMNFPGADYGHHGHQSPPPQFPGAPGGW